MKRYLCALAICLILIILGLYKLGIALYEYKGPQNGKFYATIENSAKEKQYTNAYDIKIDGKKFILYVKKSEPQTQNKKQAKIENEKTKGQFQIGDKIEFEGNFQEPAEQRNEGGFDYKLYLKTKKIYGTFKGDNIKKVGEDKTLQIAIKKKIYKIQQNNISDTYQKTLRKENTALITALLIGDKSNIEATIIDNFRDASLSHILAISGAHFSYIIIMINFINKRLKHKKIGNIISIIIILFFMQLTGNTPSVVRAGTMNIMIIMSELLYKKADIWTSLAVSIIIQIINNPYVIFDIGIQLSYGGVIGIVLFYNIIYKKIKLKTISVTLSANLVIMPIMLYNYNTISLSFIISNIFASIFLGPIIILGFLSIIIKFKPIFILLDILLSLFQDTVQICAKLPLSKIYLRTPAILSIIMFYLLLVNILKAKITNRKRNCQHKKMNTQNQKIKPHQHEKNQKLSKRKITILLILIIISNFNFQVLGIKINKDILINFVDIGQGDSTLIRTGSKTLMIDSGGTTNTNSSYDLGKNTLLPYLLYKKIIKLNYIMISHFDADHCQGFMYVLKNIKVENVIICKQAKNSELYQEFLDICKKKKIKIIYVENGDNIKIGNIELKILHPQKDLITNNPLNNNAIVLKLIYNKFTMLFTGDIEKEAEELIIRNNINIKADILKVGHHGSKTSTTQEFLQKVSPKIALIGVGENNKFGHPNEEILERLKDSNTKVYRTDQMGEIKITVDRRGKIKIKTHIKTNS